MFESKRFLAVIPARAGSKRLPKKNILNLAGKPLIEWTINAAQGSKYIDEIVVSSDDPDVWKIALKNDITVIKRPSILASDTASSFDVISHAVNEARDKFDYVILLQPTSPLRTFKHIDDSIRLLMEKKACAIISVCEVEHSPLWCNQIPKDGSLTNFISPEVKNKRGQDLPKYFRLNGAVYIADIEKLLSEQSFFLSSNIYSYVMSQKDSVDIDTELDFLLANLLLERV